MARQLTFPSEPPHFLETHNYNLENLFSVETTAADPSQRESVFYVPTQDATKHESVFSVFDPSEPFERRSIFGLRDSNGNTYSDFTVNPFQLDTGLLSDVVDWSITNLLRYTLGSTTAGKYTSYLSHIPIPVPPPPTFAKATAGPPTPVVATVGQACYSLVNSGDPGYYGLADLLSYGVFHLNSSGFPDVQHPYLADVLQQVDVPTSQVASQIVGSITDNTALVVNLLNQIISIMSSPTNVIVQAINNLSTQINSLLTYAPLGLLGPSGELEMYPPLSVAELMARAHFARPVLSTNPGGETEFGFVPYASSLLMVNPATRPSAGTYGPPLVFNAEYPVLMGSTNPDTQCRPYPAGLDPNLLLDPSAVPTYSMVYIHP